MATLGQEPVYEECIEQAYFFRIFRERLAANMPAQEILASVSQELLSTTRLPIAVEFLVSELKHQGQMAPGMARLKHYFTPFQTFVMWQAEREEQKFTMPAGLLILEREAAYKADKPTPAGLFVFQFEAICRNRLGFEDGLIAMSEDPFYHSDWRELIELVRKVSGTVEIAEIIYLHSAQYTADQLRADPTFLPSNPILFGEKEGRIAKACLDRDPLFLFSALQRQLGYPEVPRPKPREDIAGQFTVMQMKLRDLEARIRILESEAGGTFDPTKFGTPDILKDLPEIE